MIQPLTMPGAVLLLKFTIRLIFWAQIIYDPAAVVSRATTSDIAMTAMDTTNLRITFTAPSSGNVMVHMRGVAVGATTFHKLCLVYYKVPLS